MIPDVTWLTVGAAFLNFLTVAAALYAANAARAAKAEANAAKVTSHALKEDVTIIKTDIHKVELATNSILQKKEDADQAIGELKGRQDERLEMSGRETARMEGQITGEQTALAKETAKEVRKLEIPQETHDLLKDKPA